MNLTNFFKIKLFSKCKDIVVILIQFFLYDQIKNMTNPKIIRKLKIEKNILLIF